MSPVELANLCASHLAAEEQLLAAVLPSARALKDAFPQGGFDSLQNAAERQRELVQRIDDMKTRRTRLRAELARRLNVPLSDATLSHAVELVPAAARPSLRVAIERVRQMADELVSVNHWLAVHLRIHLDAYQRILRDLTGTASGSGRYGRQGATETVAYRPLIEIHG